MDNDKKYIQVDGKTKRISTIAYWRRNDITGKMEYYSLEAEDAEFEVVQSENKNIPELPLNKNKLNI